TTLFSGLTASSSPLNLPADGTYALIVHTSGHEGAYAFQLQQISVLDLATGVPYRGTLTGSGEAQLFKVTIGTSNSLTGSGQVQLYLFGSLTSKPFEVTLTDPNLQDQNEIYVSLGVPPTRDHYDYRSDNVGAANQNLLLPAGPGKYYILVYSNLAKG